MHGESTPAVEAGREFVLTVSCPDRRGIVHAVTGVMLEQNLTIAASYFRPSRCHLSLMPG